MGVERLQNHFNYSFDQSRVREVIDDLRFIDLVAFGVLRCGPVKVKPDVILNPFLLGFQKGRKGLSNELTAKNLCNEET